MIYLCREIGIVQLVQDNKLEIEFNQIDCLKDLRES